MGVSLFIKPTSNSLSLELRLWGQLNALRLKSGFSVNSSYLPKRLEKLSCPRTRKWKGIDATQIKVPDINPLDGP
jgi:hypothetical protein